MLAEVDQAFTAVASDKHCGAVVLSGAGRAFLFVFHETPFKFSGSSPL